MMRHPFFKQFGKTRVIIIIGIVLLLLSVSIVAIAFARDTDRVSRNADRRIRDAFNSIPVYHQAGAGAAVTTRMDRFLEHIDNGEQSVYYAAVDIRINTSDMLKTGNVQKDDFNWARDKFGEYQEKVYGGLGRIFSVTDDLFVTVRQMTHEDMEYYNLPPDVVEMSEYTVTISRFLQSDRKSLNMDTEFGSLLLRSNFFFGKSYDENRGIVSNLEFAKEADIQLLFGYEKGDNIIVKLQLVDEFDQEIHVGIPGKSFLIAIPLTLEFMCDKSGQLRWV